MSEHDSEPARLGLESINPVDESVSPEVIREGDRIFLTLNWKGRRETVELSLLRVQRLNAQTAAICYHLAGR